MFCFSVSAILGSRFLTPTPPAGSGSSKIPKQDHAGNKTADVGKPSHASAALWGGQSPQELPKYPKTQDNHRGNTNRRDKKSNGQ